ncbi:MAG: hypothetical protein KAR38_08825 [Calditrichia bacterium]|nr:hypothetical protein [Calditrichia bacterium]
MSNVLIVSSNIMQSKRLDIILTLEGYFCISVLNGNEVLNIIHQKRFDIIFFDEKSSDITLDEIKKSVDTLKLSLPVFVIKSTPQDEEVIADEKRNVYYVDKSVISEKLPQVINQIIDITR